MQLQFKFKKLLQKLTSFFISYLIAGAFLSTVGLCEIRKDELLKLDLSSVDENQARKIFGTPVEVRKETWVYAKSKDFTSIVLSWDKAGKLDQVIGQLAEPFKIESVFKLSDRVELREIRGQGDVPVAGHLIRNVNENIYWEVRFKNVVGFYLLKDKLLSKGTIKTFAEIDKEWPTK